MIDWENIMPKLRPFQMDQDPTQDDNYKLGYNQAVTDAIDAFKKAEKKGIVVSTAVLLTALEGNILPEDLEYIEQVIKKGIL
jgi:hypothetical protein